MGESEFLERLDRDRDLPDHHGHAPALLEAVAAKPGEILNPEREIELVLLLEPLLLIFGQHRIGDLQGFLGRQGTFVRRIGDFAVDPELRPLACGDVQVRGVPFDHFLEQDP